MRDRRPSAIFIADAPGLDFLNSIAVPTDEPVDWITSGEDLLAWMKQAGLISPEIEQSLRKSAGPGELDAVAVQARALREWFRAFVHEHKGKPLKRSALQKLEQLNRVLARDEEFGQIVARPEPRTKGHGSELIWVPQRNWRSPEALLLPIARAMADVICDEDFSHIKACEGSICTLLFVDRTRGRARRWCSMAVCGNRSKQAAHRERARGA